MIRWSTAPHMKYGGCMFGVHSVVVSIMLNADVTAITDMFNIVIHGMVHGDIELRELPIGAQSHGKHFKQGMSSAVDTMRQQLQVISKYWERH